MTNHRDCVNVLLFQNPHILTCFSAAITELRSTAAKSRSSGCDGEKVVRERRFLETRNLTISPNWKLSQADDESYPSLH